MDLRLSLKWQRPVLFKDIMNKISLCQQDLCLHVRGPQARQLGRVLIGTTLVLAAIYAVKAMR